MRPRLDGLKTQILSTVCQPTPVHCAERVELLDASAFLSGVHVLMTTTWTAPVTFAT
jgi:hypothetical protein